jgi:4-amino-4-deoxy-L-arabinose transferase-like glycosyltransferase
MINSSLKYLKNHPDLFLIFLILLLAPLFFYKLGASSLVSFDEAWYAGVARNIYESGDFINMNFNGKVYYDHPASGYWLSAIAFKIFGLNEFAARLPQALSGLLSLVVVYLLGKELFNRTVGFIGALALSSSLWFMFRARSGNLDISLTFFFLLSLYLAHKATQKKAYLMPLSISLAFLFLMKTIVPFTIIPALLVIFWRSKKYSFKDYLGPGLIFLFIAGGWFLSQHLQHPEFLNRYLSIGLPGVKTETSYMDNLKLTKEYLHSGIGKWFWPGIFSIFASLFLLQKRFFILFVFFITFSLPFLFSSKGHIWHLIPLHPIMILSFFGFFYVLLERFLKKKFYVVIIILGIGIYFWFFQIQIAWNQFININGFISDDAILSKEASKYSGRLYVDGDFVPTAVFYSGKKVDQVVNDALVGIFKNPEPFLLITKQSRLDQYQILPDKYRVLKSDRDKILILKE